MGTGRSGRSNASGRDRQTCAYSVHCAECKTSSGLYWHGWKAYRTDNPELDEPPALAFYCPSCARREFGVRTPNGFGGG